MKKFVIAAMIAACIALCTAVWLHGNAVGETPVPATKTAVSARCRQDLCANLFAGSG